MRGVWLLMLGGFSGNRFFGHDRRFCVGQAKVGDRRKQQSNVRRKGLRGTLNVLWSVGSQFFLPSGRIVFRTASSIAPANVTFI